MGWERRRGEDGWSGVWKLECSVFALEFLSFQFYGLLAGVLPSLQPSLSLFPQPGSWMEGACPEFCCLPGEQEKSLVLQGAKGYLLSPIPPT